MELAKAIKVFAALAAFGIKVTVEDEHTFEVEGFFAAGTASVKLDTNQVAFYHEKEREIFSFTEETLMETLVKTHLAWKVKTQKNEPASYGTAEYAWEMFMENDPKFLKLMELAA